MRLHRFIGDFDLSKNEVKITDPQIIKKIKAVLRIKSGEKIILSDGRGEEAETTLISIGSELIKGLVGKKERRGEVEGGINLYLSILKKENFELAVQKAVETGVSSITPTITERTIKTGLNFERLKKIIKEASEQSGRSIVPHLHSILNFEDAIIDGKKSKIKILFHPAGNFYRPNKEQGAISIFIGPEGGFTERELERAKEEEYDVFSLGHFTLRAETAAMIAVYRTANNI
ncbi:hypothetical protein A3D42_00835 [Candidatus Nomurabacteria bacterium RIFCSPHIGHO2_02_FULL_41_18]|uniref:Ribosomal RNA small subunit methyltransferase E n=1 Tax=Candidatus Nomurabacteria bacterium RIFCSPHIGHO2_02_FULL_41_18 TaxID=1801754 RepID=A0A1F6W585_9BACT|nr:MAG: hypothetical protein A2737_00965 [Candidatus Nomurabacteria bacterium RIFCSPHIGHO2_01_FULL_41_71]OGI77051.1 MAG: hypothetical protein A3D42_00835 [Candidatus Nomurabacteria bacterium RIFCSPHIGHO2_02_FULL_41_18]OGI90145.1 MAG: hypothetical protein A3B01_02490 [Candidatus Nomurabacteria bacterium RIFCSPLOWO2_01_FULL_41_52b]OGJ00471.1 MAG: hypothetical protein A3I90_02215 [Candidatus Nomurabacteria bacterium RIFCSPLOWO2_02_FULL_41_9]